VLGWLGLGTLRQGWPGAPTLREAKVAGNTSDVDVEQQLPGESGGVNSLPDIPLGNIPLPILPFPDGPLPDLPLPDVPVLDARPDGLVGEEWTSRRVAEE